MPFKNPFIPFHHPRASMYSHSLHQINQITFLHPSANTTHLYNHATRIRQKPTHRVRSPTISSSLAVTAFNFKPSIISFAPPSPCPRSGRRVAAGVRSEMRVYKGTHMREKRLAEMIEQKVAEAKQVCGEDETSDECKVAWDEVEEVSQAKADLRLKIHHLQVDPLEHFCLENPETDECRIYED